MAKLNLGKLTSKAKELVDKNGDKIASGVDKVTNKIDTKTKGKYHDKLEKIDNAAAKLDKTKGDDVEPTEAAAAAGDTVPPAATPPAAAAPTTPPVTPPAAASTDFPEPS